MAYLNAEWQGWPKPGAVWKNQKELETQYAQLLQMLEFVCLDAAQKNSEELSFLMHRITEQLAAAYDMQSSLFGGK